MWHRLRDRDSWILASPGAARVTGFDRSPAAVSEANREFGGTCRTFQVADARELPLGAGTCDVYVSLMLQNAKSPAENRARRVGSRHNLSVNTERRARDSNPQPLAGHLISSLVPDSPNTQTGQEIRDSPKCEVPVLVPSPPNPVSDPGPPADLARVVAAWDRLPDAIKAGILALVNAAGDSNA